MLQPEKSTEILENILPPSIDFYRTPIAPTSPPPKRLSPSIPAGSALSRAAEAAAAERASKEETAKVPEKISIFGSVSTGDIAANIRAVLAEDIQGQRVVLSPENISFVGEMHGSDRIKYLGSFEVEIKLDIAPGGVRRMINVKAQE